MAIDQSRSFREALRWPEMCGNLKHRPPATDLMEKHFMARLDLRLSFGRSSQVVELKQANRHR